MPEQYFRMLIALLAVLGVDLIVIVVLLAAVLSRRGWVSHQTGAFRGAIRVVDGKVPGLKPKWKRGYGRWVHEILVWNKAPFLLGNEFVAADALAGEVRAAKPGEIRRVGKNPVVIPLAVDGDARIEVVTAQDRRDRAHGPFADAPGAGASSPAAV